MPQEHKTQIYSGWKAGFPALEFEWGVRGGRREGLHFPSRLAPLVRSGDGGEGKDYISRHAWRPWFDVVTVGKRKTTFPVLPRGHGACARLSERDRGRKWRRSWL
eukprot:g25817.t1